MKAMKHPCAVELYHHSLNAVSQLHLSN